MKAFHYFSGQPKLAEIPAHCRNPFNNDPHPLAVKASNQLQQYLNDSPQLTTGLFDDDNGKMFGVLVVTDKTGAVGYLSGFSGMLNKQWIVPGFVPPVFDIQRQQSFLKEGEFHVSKLTLEIETCLNSPMRLRKKEQLSKIEKQYQSDLAKLKIKLKNNKADRQIKRSSLKNKQRLQDLSFQSQQDKRELKNFKLRWSKKISEAHVKLNEYDDDIKILRDKRKLLSQQLHKKVFDRYYLINKFGQQKSMSFFYGNQVPPGGAGDCAAPKMIQFAHQNKLEILAMAEFWWGASPAKGVRQHAHFYPPCRGKCFPILPYMLEAVVYEKNNEEESENKLLPEIIYEDESLLVIHKPAGLLSIPGKQQKHSVLSWLKQRYPKATGSLLVHRLDMATSGLLLAAKDAQSYKYIQKQFINRSIKKRYVAVLSKPLNDINVSVNLPLRVDLDDRPRQLVCFEHGKAAVTHVKVISTDETSCRVYFYPVTGRTHQLRVHAAHISGLNAPIVGDELYGVRAERLLLHADKISLNHPLTGEIVTFNSKVPF